MEIFVSLRLWHTTLLRLKTNNLKIIRELTLYAVLLWLNESYLLYVSQVKVMYIHNLMSQLL